MTKAWAACAMVILGFGGPPRVSTASVHSG